MKLVTGHHGTFDRYGAALPAYAANQTGLNWERQTYSAIADARMTAGVVNVIAAYHLELLQEQVRLKT